MMLDDVFVLILVLDFFVFSILDSILVFIEIKRFLRERERDKRRKKRA